MASGKVRCTRKLWSWIVQQVESSQFPGVCWDDAAKTMLGNIQAKCQLCRKPFSIVYQNMENYFQ
uniref:Uncharacterized protein n=1 Tax=Mus spicilegus TaxID=10103 RepID=A0A8C6GKD9_MUSSI